MSSASDESKMASSRVTRFVEFGKKIVCVGRNYSEHAKELGNAVPSEPVIFLKPTSSYITEGAKIKLPQGVSSLHHEVELGLVVGKEGAQIPPDRALDHVAGYCLALDMTNRDLQSKLKNKGLPWALSKGFDTSCPVSDFIPKEKIADPANVELWLKVNGSLRQAGNTRDMIFPLSDLVSYISNTFRLEPGDVILTGTPHGVGPVSDGDVIECGLKDIVSMTFGVQQ